MIKVTEIVKRAKGLTVEEFQDHWLHSHGPIVAEMPGLLRYAQSHTRPGGYRRGEPAYDGIAELWFQDKEALRSIATTDEFAAAKADEPKFIDPDSLIELVVDEHVIKDGPAPAGGIKSIEFVNLRPDLTVTEAQRYWREVHGPIAARIPTMSRYVQSHVRVRAFDRPTPPAFAGTAVTWWADIDAMRASAVSEEYRLTREDEPNFIGDELQVILTEEHIVFG